MVSKDKSEWDGWYLVRDFYKDASPFDVLTDQIRENAIDISRKTRPEILRGMKEDNYDYLAQREVVENWLRDSAKAGGVDIRKQHPVYFTLTRDPESFARKYRTDNRKAIIIPASEVDMSALSFTWDDSFPNYRVAQSGEELEVFKSPLHGKVLNAKQVAAAVKKYGEPKVDNPDMYRYIEAQMWDKPALTDFPHAVIHDVKPPAMHRAPVAKVSP